MPHSDPHQLGPLFERWRAGDGQAWNDLLGKLRPHLKALIRSWLGPDLARLLDGSDIAQDALLRMTQGGAGFRGQGAPELLGWAKRIAFHATVDRKAKGVGGRQAESDRLRALPARDPSPLDVLEGEEEAIRLAAALEQLSAPRREVIEARLLDGLPFPEISRRMGKSEGALRVLFGRAAEQLRQILETEV
jgi:RNA polymerase sigma-70 factor (ECF subfamily)